MEKEKAEQLVEVQKYENQYSEEKFWDKVAKVAKKAGIKTIYQALRLYYTIHKLPIEKKAIVLGGLGYFIFPADLIPDVIVGLGFTDDATVLFAIYNSLKDYLDEETEVKAKEQLANWFGDYNEDEINIS